MLWRSEYKDSTCCIELLINTAVQMQLAHRGDAILTCGHGQELKYSVHFERFSLAE